MSDNQNGGWIMPLLILMAVYAAYRVVEAVVAAIEMFLMWLVGIALVATAILTAYFLYKFLSDKRYGDTKRLREIEKLERERKLHTSRLPKHMKEAANQYYYEKQNALYDLKPGSRVDAMLDRTKQVLSTFRGKNNGNKDSHR